MMRRLLVVLAPVLLALTGLAAPVQAATAHITISNFGYSGDLHVQPGEHVQVVNNDSVNHTLTDKRTHLWNTGAIPPNGGMRSFTAPSRVGRYPFGCLFHPEMHGVLTVGNPPDDTALTTSPNATVKSGAAHTLSTKLTDTTTHHPLAGTHVVLQKRSSGAFRTLKTVLTNSSGAASVVVHPRSRTAYRWHFVAARRHAAATSGVTTITTR
jgi:plastocyanin